MKQLIDKAALIAEIKRIRDKAFPNSEWNHGYAKACESIISLLDTLEVKEVETPVIPKYSYFEHIYHCGSEPRWKIGDVLAVYELYSDHEGEHICGKITDVKMGENEDWLYTFENGDVEYENTLIRDETYKKN